MSEKIYDNTLFENTKHIDENGVEFWYARELQIVLDYKQWHGFSQVIDKAKESCKSSEISVSEHFVGIDKMVQASSGTERKRADYKLTRFPCYMIIQNSDSRKKPVALAQTYIVYKTMKKELNDIAYDLFRITYLKDNNKVKISERL